MKQSVKRIAKQWLLPVPNALRKRQIKPDPAGFAHIEHAIRTHYHQDWRSEAHYSPEKYQEDLQAHLSERLENDRRLIVPWLNKAKPLRGQRILEIGCGTGSSTVALAEQGAEVTGIDIDIGALKVARERAAVYGISAEFQSINANQLLKTFGTNRFDSIIFFASLEHMTLTERLASLRDAWRMLQPGGLLVIIETPNRLWFFDSHTSRLPFFNWLPDKLAFRYSQFSPRENFRELYRQYTPEAAEHFLRRGRGMSFHELEIAIGDVRKLEVVSSISSFLGMRYRLKQSAIDREYKRLLGKIYPDIHPGFFDDHLYLILAKS
jgi:S-adenosylmethionine-dependent methyltransferase